MTKRKLLAKDIEELENTTVATILAGAGGTDVLTAMTHGGIVECGNTLCANTVACLINICGASCGNTCCTECSITTCFCTEECTALSGVDAN